MYPWLAKFVLDSNNNGIWSMVDISILTMVYKPTYNWGGHNRVCTVNHESQWWDAHPSGTSGSSTTVCC